MGTEAGFEEVDMPRQTEGQRFGCSVEQAFADVRMMVGLKLFWWHTRRGPRSALVMKRSRLVNVAHLLQNDKWQSWQVHLLQNDKWQSWQVRRFSRKSVSHSCYEAHNRI
jgi:hypothetical protein